MLKFDNYHLNISVLLNSSMINTTLSRSGYKIKKSELSQKELKDIKNQIYNISDYFEEDFFETKKIVYVGI